jgi:hypothetical protein
MARWNLIWCVTLVALIGCEQTDPPEQPADGDTGTTSSAAASPDDGAPVGLVELELDLPKPMFKETPKNIPPGTQVEPARKGPREPILVPQGVTNVAQGKPVTASDDMPIIGSNDLVTDGKKDADEGSWLELGPGVQWVQIDLGSPHELHAIAMWFYHAQARVYHDVIVRTASDADFIEDVQTLFNNDHDNSAGMGIGDDMGFWETYEGKLLKLDGGTARYLRVYTNGNTSDPMNQFTEIEIYGRPVE